jgi:hypothetical protein
VTTGNLPQAAKGLIAHPENPMLLTLPVNFQARF